MSDIDNTEPTSRYSKERYGNLNFRPRITGEDRVTLGSELARGYEIRLRSVRQLAEEYGLSYGTARNILTEARVVFRPRGGRGA